MGVVVCLLVVGNGCLVQVFLVVVLSCDLFVVSVSYLLLLVVDVCCLWVVGCCLLSCVVA